MENHSELVARFLEFACWDHHVHGKGDHRMYDCAAQRLLAQHPEIARDSIYTAVVCGDMEEVERILTDRPEAAREAGGPRGWTPLLYLCYTRFSHQPSIDNAVAIARLLFKNGANSNDLYMAGDAKYTALVGVAGEGEQDSPRQPNAEEMFQLLLEHGAEPFDIQVLYDTHFSGDMIWWLDLIYNYTIMHGRAAEWRDPNWAMLDMGGYGPGAYFILSTALKKNDIKLAEWALTHGAIPSEPTSTHQKFKPKRTLYEDAVLNGLSDIAGLLLRHGARETVPVLDDQESFIAACFRLDRDVARDHLKLHPEYLTTPLPMFTAARRNRPDVIGFLLDLGVSIDVSDEFNTHALHHAAAKNSLAAAKFLIEHGAEVDPREAHWDATPIGWAGHGDKTEMIDFLSQYSRNVWTLAFRGHVNRLREVIKAEPDRAKSVTREGITVLWWLPDDEAKAMEIVELLLANGADPSARSKSGSTAAGWALKRGMLDVADRLEALDTSDHPDGSSHDDGSSKEHAGPSVEEYEDLARDLIVAYETGHDPALQRLNDHFNRSLTWDQLRAVVRDRLRTLPDDQRPQDGMYEGYFALPHAQLFIARHAGFDNWQDLVRSIGQSETRTYSNLQKYSDLVDDVLSIYRTGDSAALERLCIYTQQDGTPEYLRKLIQKGLGKPENSDLSLEEARQFVARAHKFKSWQAMSDHIETLQPGSVITISPVKFFQVDKSGARHSAGNARDWDTVINLIKENRISGLDANGEMNDEILERISHLENVTALYLDGSQRLTDTGLRNLERMPQLQHLELSGCDITDRGLEFLRRLRELRSFAIYHHSGITDAGTANLADCVKLEKVDLMGTSTGDGTIAALAEKPALRYFKAGNLVTDDGLALLQNFPVFRNWQGGEVEMSLTSPDAKPNFLWLNLKSPITDQGIRNLSKLEGLFALSLFGTHGSGAFDSINSQITPLGLRYLLDLPNLGWLGCTSELCNDEAMREISALHRLRFLMCQDAIAGDDGFVSLSNSKSIEYIWGRRCHNLTGRGFAALSAMQALRSLSVSCKNVDDSGLATLPKFPALTELMPMDVPDEGYIHIGRCDRLESLILMYCNDTTDLATEKIYGLSRLKSYSAGNTKITDVSLKILGNMQSLERINLWGLSGVTNSGLVFLAGLPGLREILLHDLPNVTAEGAAIFPSHVNVDLEN